MATTELGRNTRCANCGRSLYKGERVWVKGGFGKTLALGLYQATTAGQSHLGKFYCSQGCLNEMTAGPSGGGASGNGIVRGGNAGGITGGLAGAVSGKIAATTSKEDARAAESNERHKNALQAIKDYQFDETDEESFTRSAVLFFSEYTSCHPGLMSDNDHKNAYRARAEQELKVLKACNPVFVEKFQSLYDEAKTEMGNKVKKRIKISLIIFGSGIVIGLVSGLIVGIVQDALDYCLSTGAMAGVLGGALLAGLPQMGAVSNTKEGNE